MFCGPKTGARFYKTQTGASQCGQQVCYCRRKLTAAHIRDTVKPASWHQAQENMNGRCNLSQLNALFAEGKTHTPWAQNWDHTFGSWAANFSIVAPFLGPESGPCFGAGPKNGATILKLAAQLPNVWSQFWAHGVCVLPSAKSALSCDRLHLPFMFSCAWCQDAGFTCRVRSEGKAKSMQAHSPKNGSASQRKPKERFKRGRDASAVLQQT